MRSLENNKEKPRGLWSRRMEMEMDVEMEVECAARAMLSSCN